MPTTVRAERAKEMDSEVEWVGDIARVQSESKDGEWYLVDLEHMRCSCPDHVYRGTTCKHMFKAAADSDLLSLWNHDLLYPKTTFKGVRDHRTMMFLIDEINATSYKHWHIKRKAEITNRPIFRVYFDPEDKYPAVRVL